MNDLAIELFDIESNELIKTFNYNNIKSLQITCIKYMYLKL